MNIKDLQLAWSFGQPSWDNLYSFFKLYFKFFLFFLLLVIVDNIVKIVGYVNVGTCRVSPDHNYLAYTLDISGGERYTLQVKDLRSGLIDPKSKVDGAVSLAWAQDASSLFYTQSDENQRPYRQSLIIRFHLLVFSGGKKNGFQCKMLS